MIAVVIAKRLAQIARRIDHALDRLGRRCCVLRSQRLLDRARLSAR
jgi:hypothetical protein